MLTIALACIPIFLYFLVDEEDIKVCLLIWSAIFLADVTINVTDEVYFQTSVLIDCLLILSCSVIRERWKMFGCMFVLAVSALLNLREGLSYYQTSTYTFLVYYQWLSIEIITAILLFKVRLRDDIFRVSRTHH